MDNTILILICINILLSIGSILIKEYLKEKGKNIATKEDIEQITEKIENVKNELSYKNQQKIEWNENTKKLLLDFYSNYINLSDDYLKNFTIFYNDISDPNAVRNHMEKIAKEHSELKHNFYKLNIYEAKDSKFLEKLSKLLNDLNIVYGEIKIHLMQIENYIKINNISLQKDNTIYKNLVERRQEEFEKIFEILEKNTEKKNNNFNELSNLIYRKIKEKYNE